MYHEIQPSIQVLALLSILGPITERGKDLPSDKNHADYVDKNGFYDIIKIQLDYKALFPAVFNVAVSQLSPHLTPEVYYESLFSQACYISNQPRVSSKVRIFEQLVIAKPKQGENVYLKRKEKCKWYEGEERDDQIFLDVEKKVYLDSPPHNQEVFGEDEDGSGEKNDDIEEMSENDDGVSI